MTKNLNGKKTAVCSATKKKSCGKEETSYMKNKLINTSLQNSYKFMLQLMGFEFVSVQVMARWQHGERPVFIIIIRGVPRSVEPELLKLTQSNGGRFRFIWINKI